MMGIIEKVVRECTCDICNQPCEETDSKLQIQIHGGDGRDVGPSYIYATIKVEIPYSGINGGIVCKTCQARWFHIYVNQLLGKPKVMK